MKQLSESQRKAFFAELAEKERNKEETLKRTQKLSKWIT